MIVWKLTMNEYDNVVFKNLEDLTGCIKVELENELEVDEEIQIIIVPSKMSDEDFESLVEADI